MTRTVKLYDLAPSPNNLKVRIALKVKNIPFERIDVALGDEKREALVSASNQPLSPVLLDGDTTIFDSGAILRYLEANFPDTTPLFSTNRDEMREIERWEWMGRTSIGEPLGAAAQQLFSEDPDPEAIRQAGILLTERTGPIEKQLESGEYLVGGRLTAADITCAVPVFYSILPPEFGEQMPMATPLIEHFNLGDGRDRTRAWAQKIAAIDLG